MIKVNKLIKFNALEKSKIKNLGWIPNPNLGVIDVETYLNNKNVFKIYALGFRIYLSTKPVIYYMYDNNNDSDSLVL